MSGFEFQGFLWRVYQEVNTGRLVLKIKDGERIKIGEICLQCKIDGARIKICIDADRSLPIVRESAKVKEPKKR